MFSSLSGFNLANPSDATIVVREGSSIGVGGWLGMGLSVIVTQTQFSLDHQVASEYMVVVLKALGIDQTDVLWGR